MTRHIILLLFLLVVCWSTFVMCGSKAVDGRQLEGQHFEGDIAMRNKPPAGGHGAMLAALRDASKRWPGGRVPYRIDTDSIPNMDHHRLIRRAMDHISEKVNCIKFVENQKLARPKRDFIRIASDGDDKNSALGCWSYLGMVGGEQTLNLDGNCFREDLIVHELLHALSFIHEQNRSDRDNYVKIHNEHIKAGMESQFTKMNEADVNDNNTPYDFRSRLHYPPKAFTKSGEDTIVALYPGNDNFGPMDAGLSPIDIVEVSILYDCQVNNKDIIEYIHQNRLASEMRIEILDDAHFEVMEEMKSNLDNITSEVYDLKSEMENMKSLLAKLAKKEGSCAVPWTKLSTGCYRFLQRPMNWREAQQLCQSIQGKLVEIDSAEENEAIIKEIKKQGYNKKKIEFWLGLTDLNSEGDWRLESTGESPVYTNWSKNEPNDNHKGGEDCAHINSIFKFNDKICDEASKSNGYSWNALCEKM